MQVTHADIADRYSILRLKHERLPQNDSVDEELGGYRRAMVDSHVPTEAVAELYSVNGKIWDLESDLRQGKEGKLDATPAIKALPMDQLLRMAEVGRRALAIRELNGQRIAIKNRISSERGDCPEVKGDHASNPI